MRRREELSSQTIILVDIVTSEGAQRGCYQQELCIHQGSQFASFGNALVRATLS